jgi:DNA-binding transcriptional MerR regulator
MATSCEKRFFTTTEVARELGVHREQVAYAVRRSGLHPDERAGNIGLWTASSVQRIRAAVDGIRQSKCGRPRQN